MPQKITPFLWFNDNAEEATTFYVSLFDDAEILGINRHDAGPVISTSFRLAGQEFMALNGGPLYAFTEATSFFISCETQTEVDTLWDKLTAGGQSGQCGWLKDKFGLSWQVIPTILGDLLQDPDPAKANRVLQAMLQMTKIDVAKLRQAHQQE